MHRCQVLQAFNVVASMIARAIAKRGVQQAVVAVVVELVVNDDRLGECEGRKDGLNADTTQAHLLARRAQSLNAKVNLIPYNTVEGLTWKRPAEDACRAFRDTLAEHGVPATLRLEKGHDIDAACGQLRLKEEKSLKER